MPTVIKSLFDSLPDLAGIMLAALGVAFFFWSELADKLKPRRRLRAVFVGVFVLIGAGGMVSNNLQKSADKRELTEKDRELREKLGEAAGREKTLQTQVTNLTTTEARTAEESRDRESTLLQQSTTLTRLQLANGRLQQQLISTSDTIKTLAQNTIEAVTGGDSYLEIRSSYRSPVSGEVILFAGVQKTNSAGAFTFRLIEVKEEDYCFTGQQGEVLGTGETGNIAARSDVILPFALHPQAGIENHYCVIMQSKNGQFREILNLRLNERTHGWESSYAILDSGNVVVATRKWM